jgi:hypothetical protein
VSFKSANGRASHRVAAITLTPGSYLLELIMQESCEVARRQNGTGYIAMWAEAVRKVMERFPKLTAAERAALLDTVDSGIQELSGRLNLDIHQFTGARDSVVQIL